MSRLWKKKDIIFVFDQNALILSNRMEDLLYKLKSSIGCELDIINIVDVYIEKQKEIISYLERHGIDYYSDEFTLNKIILNKLETEIEFAEKEIVKAINKTKRPIYKTFIKTNFSKFVIAKNILNYNRFIENIKKYNFAHDIDNIIRYKYSSINHYYLKETIQKDKNILNKLGRKDLINYINIVSKKN